MGSRGIGLMRKSRANQICLQWTFSSPGGQKMWKKKRHCLRVLGVFPLKGKDVEEPVGFVHCIIVYVVNINDTLIFMFERAHVFLTDYCMGLFSKEWHDFWSHALKLTKWGHWAFAVWASFLFLVWKFYASFLVLPCRLRSYRFTVHRWMLLPGSVWTERWTLYFVILITDYFNDVETDNLFWRPYTQMYHRMYLFTSNAGKQKLQEYLHTLWPSRPILFIVQNYSYHGLEE